MNSERIALIQRAMKIKHDIEQIFFDVEHWNRVHPDEEPLDPDPDGRLHAHHKTLTTLLENELRLAGVHGKEATNAQND